MTPDLAPIEKPHGLLLKLLYKLMRKQFGVVPSWLSVFSARMPVGFTTWMGKVGRLQKKLTLDQDMVVLMRARVDALNTCTWCADAGRWYVAKKTPHLVAKLDALPDYQTSQLFTDPERAAFDFASELTEHHHVSSDTFEAVSRHYSERQICELTWVVSSNHLFNINNVGLGIGSQGLCEVARKADQAAAAPQLN
jgi:alkylhydroperoxidase family enzyme